MTAAGVATQVLFINPDYPASPPTADGNAKDPSWPRCCIGRFCHLGRPSTTTSGHALWDYYTLFRHLLIGLASGTRPDRFDRRFQWAPTGCWAKPGPRRRLGGA